MLAVLQSHPGSEAFRLWMQNGGEWAMAHDLDDLRKQITEMANITPLAIELNVANMTIGVVHAEVPGNDWRCWHRARSTKEETLAIWGRSTVFAALSDLECPPVTGIDYVVFGHTPLTAPARISNRLYLDTGGGYPGGKPTVKEINRELVGMINDKPTLFRESPEK